MRKLNAFDAGFIALCAALNVSVGYLVSLLKLPLYLDSIGTILSAVLGGWMYGIIVGIATLVVLSLTATPTIIAYTGTAVVIASAASAFARFGFLRTLKHTIAGGLAIGLLSALVSTPVTTLLYGGVSLAGSDMVTAVFRATGLTVWKSVLLGSLVTDLVDKCVSAIVCFAMIRSLPERTLRRFPRGGRIRRPGG